VQKENTELRLKIDVLQSTSGGLSSEKKHLQLELRETKELNERNELKIKELNAELSKTANEL